MPSLLKGVELAKEIKRAKQGATRHFGMAPGRCLKPFSRSGQLNSSLSPSSISTPMPASD
jgi:hypothetical protein